MLVNHNHSSSFNRVKMTMTVTSTVISIILMHGVQANADSTTASQQTTQQATTNNTTSNATDSSTSMTTNASSNVDTSKNTDSNSSTLAASQTVTNTNQQSVSGSTTDAAKTTTKDPAKQAANAGNSSSTNVSQQQASANFNESTASTAYLMKGVNVYDATTGTTVKQVTTDNNIQILRQADSTDGRVFVELKDSKVIGYVDAAAIQSTPQVVNDDNGVTHYTRADLDSIIDSLNNSNVWAPKVESGTLNSDITGLALHNNQTGEDVKLKVWDSWPVENQDGTVADYHGYRLVIGLTAPADNSTDWYYGKMGLFAQKIGGSDDISSWQYLGNVFNTFGEGADLTNDQYLKYMEAEWSGSTVMVNANDDSLRFFYTNYGTKGQILTTAKVYVEPKDSFDWNSGLIIDHSKTTDHKSIFAGDGSTYQTAAQDGGFLTSFGDAIALRDPHVVYSGGEAYLAFEAATGLDDGYQGVNNIYNKAYYGMSDTDFQKSLLYFLNNKGSAAYDKAVLGNAAIGIVKLKDDFTVSQIEKPIVAFNGITDEVERPNLFERDGKWYLFVTAHGWHMSTDNVRITLGEMAK
ncbi:Glucan-binding domain (YG repeat) [Fructobacillus fructosus]|uniref:Glucan-binding domain (YG repeat) n=1 Tax=Fructobacillus fructosus TaxID=1631 RepID=A0ABM9MVA8_9LACO|nr:Glucan-binding domain (YG repeat) [Fructobacillus fructosus]